MSNETTTDERTPAQVIAEYEQASIDRERATTRSLNAIDALLALLRQHNSIATADTMYSLGAEGDIESAAIGLNLAAPVAPVKAAEPLTHHPVDGRALKVEPGRCFDCACALQCDPWHSASRENGALTRQHSSTFLHGDRICADVIGTTSHYAYAEPEPLNLAEYVGDDARPARELRGKTCGGEWVQVARVARRGDYFTVHSSVDSWWYVHADGRAVASSGDTVWVRKGGAA